MEAEQLVCTVHESFRLRVGDVLDLGLDDDWGQVTAQVVRVNACAALVQPISKAGKATGQPYRISANSEVPILSRGGAQIAPLGGRKLPAAVSTLPGNQNAPQPLMRRDLLRRRTRSLPCTPAKDCPDKLPANDTSWEPTLDI